MVDALSRRLDLNSLVEIFADWKQQIIAKYAKNQLATNLLESTLHDERYQMVDGLIHYKGRIFLVPDSKCKKRIF